MNMLIVYSVAFKAHVMLLTRFVVCKRTYVCVQSQLQVDQQEVIYDVYETQNLGPYSSIEMNIFMVGISSV